MSSKNSNRRGSSRHMRPGGFARCLSSGAEKRYRVFDASRTGVAIQGGPGLNLGTEVGVSLWWPRIGRASAQGVVCRHVEALGQLALHYTADDGMSDLVNKLKTIERMRQEEPVPLICGTGELISMATEHLDNAGITYVHAKSPLGALQHLQNPWEPVTSLVFEPDANWLALSALVGSEHPDVERVLLNHGECRVDPVEPGSDSLFDRGLSKPWHPNGLYDALSLELGASNCVCCDLPLSTTVSPFCARCVGRSSNLSPLDDLGGSD